MFCSHWIHGVISMPVFCLLTQHLAPIMCLRIMYSEANKINFLLCFVLFFCQRNYSLVREMSLE